MIDIKDILKLADEIEQKIGYCFHDRQLLMQAFIHRSFVNEHREVSAHNERLEFLGDSVLGLVISDYLYCQLPELTEGDLSILRSRIVNAASCVTNVQKLGLEKYLLLGKGERQNDGRGRDTILADLFEALIGAMYLDGGIEVVKKFIFTHFGQSIEIATEGPKQNAKAILQDLSQKKFQQIPIYQVVSENGPDHSKNFKIAVFIAGTQVGCGHGSSKKQAQQEAAEDALKRGSWA